MSNALYRVAAAVMLTVGLAPAAEAARVAAPGADLGRAEYAAQCAQCHGPQGRGDGPQAREMKLPVPDLGTLAQRAGDRFPAERVRRVIDGRDDIKGHAGRQMPLWGQRYRRHAGGSAAGEAEVQRRIEALVEHLRTLQR